VIRFSLQPRPTDLAADLVDEFLDGAAVSTARHAPSATLPIAW
jgi:hypothetical protein